ncbi:MAG: acetyl-CoA C-acetyltransferase [Chitinophagales bacterium]|nr:acetyl-CoA C-acetyltransferase [Chitinophagales bacterium]
MSEAYIYDALRTPRSRGKYSGELYEVKPIDILSVTLKALKQRLKLDTELVDDVVIGCVTPIDDQGYNIAKAAVMHAGWGNVSGMQLNRYCASGLEAVNLAAVKIRSGWEQLVVAGGIESMSRVPMGSDGGALLYDPEVITSSHYIPQGVSADLIATREGFTREQLDAYALLSQQRAHAAQKNNYFQSSIIPIYDANGLLILDRDSAIRPKTTLEQLASLPLAFQQMGAEGFDQMALHKYPEVEAIHHLHTAGNSSGIVDGASLVLIGSEEAGKQIGVAPRARIRAVATVAVDPTLMLVGPAPAAQKALKQAGMKKEDIDLWECNEAFAAVVLQFMKKMELEEDVVNVNGGAIAMGHPLGATGAMLLGTILDELERRDLNTGLVTLCVGGGMGVATIIERV